LVIADGMASESILSMMRICLQEEEEEDMGFDLFG
jgi:hypothetical protein